MEFKIKKRLDCKKIKSIEDVKLILDGMNLYIDNTSENYDELKHLFKELEENELFKVKHIKDEEEMKYDFGNSLIPNFSSKVVPRLEVPEHYSNEKGSLYKIGLERGWNPYQFDAIKRIDRIYKKGQFEEDVKKTELVLKLMQKKQ